MRRHTVFAQLVTATLALLIGIGLLWLLVSLSFLHTMDRANSRRWMAGAVANQLLQLRVHGQEFLLRDAKDSTFYQTGDAPSLQDQSASLTLLTTWIDSLVHLSSGPERATTEQLRKDVNSYAVAFQALATTMRKRGVANVQADTDAAIAALEGQTDDAVSDMDPVLATIIVSSVRDSNAARHRLVAAIPLLLLFGMGMAVGAVYLFGRGLTYLTTALERAANDIGQGKFHNRVTTRAKNELGRLAAAFNQMAEDLAVLVGAVHHSSMQITTSTAEIAATARQQQETASEIATTTGQVDSTAKDISTTSRELASIVTQAASVAEATATLAEQGQVGLALLDGTMRKVADAGGAVNTQFSGLNEHAETINTVVTTMLKVADQTNILSLNAAIEAEKAGEYGHGFSVVAAEIQRLADQTAVATGNIERIIKEMQSAVKAGVIGMSKFTEDVRRSVDVSTQVSGQLSEIIQKVQVLAPNLEIINTGTQSQAAGAEQISAVLSRLSTSVRLSAESMVKSEQAIEQLHDASQQLQAGVSRFTVAV